MQRADGINGQPAAEGACPASRVKDASGRLRALIGVVSVVLCSLVLLGVTAAAADAQTPPGANQPSQENQPTESGDEPGDGGEDSGGEDSGEGSSDESGSEDSGEDEGGFLKGIVVDMFKALTNWIGDGIEQEAQRRTADLAAQLTDGRYMIEPPSNQLTEIYRDTANWAKFAAVPLLLLLGLSMCLRGANYDTAYAAQTGIPKIITVLAAIAFMPEIISLIADMTQSIANAVINLDAMQQGFESLAKEEMLIKVSPGLSILVWVIKGVLSVLLLLAIAIQNLVFGILFMIGPLALIFHAIPKFSDVAAAWFRGILACFAISILWAVEFGFGYRLVGDPTILYSGTGWRTLPLLLSLGILWLAWKTPWWVYQWAFYSYSAGGGGGGTRGAMAALSLFKLFKK
jgi:hypothetical protein